MIWAFRSGEKGPPMALYGRKERRSRHEFAKEKVLRHAGHTGACILCFVTRIPTKHS
jgi:hypothetical protein